MFSKPRQGSLLLYSYMYSYRDSYRHQTSFLKLLDQPKDRRGKNCKTRKANFLLLTERLSLSLQLRTGKSRVMSLSSGLRAETQSQVNVTPGTAGSLDNSASWAQCLTTANPIYRTGWTRPAGLLAAPRSCKSRNRRPQSFATQPVPNANPKARADPPA